MSAAVLALPATADPTPWVDSCPGCQGLECDDWGLCDIDLSIVGPVPAQDRPAAIREIGEAWGIDGRTMDGDELSDLVLALTSRGRGSYVGRDEAHSLLTQGWSFDDLARHADVPVSMIVHKFTQIVAAPLDSVLEAERLLRAPGATQASVAKATGLDVFQVLRLTRVLNIQTETMALKAAGMAPNRKYTPEQVELAWRLKDGGQHTLRQISVELGFADDPNIAAGIMRRNARPASLTDLRELETVGA